MYNIKCIITLLLSLSLDYSVIAYYCITIREELWYKVKILYKEGQNWCCQLSGKEARSQSTNNGLKTSKGFICSVGISWVVREFRHCAYGLKDRRRRIPTMRGMLYGESEVNWDRLFCKAKQKTQIFQKVTSEKLKQISHQWNWTAVCTQSKRKRERWAAFEN